MSFLCNDEYNYLKIKSNSISELPEVIREDLPTYLFIELSNHEIIKLDLLDVYLYLDELIYTQNNKVYLYSDELKLLELIQDL